MSDAAKVKTFDLLAKVATKALTDAHATTAPEHHAHRIDAERAHRDRMEAELAPLVRSIVGHFTESTDLPEGVAELFAQACEPEHAALFDAMVAVVLAFAFQVMGSLVPPVLQSTVNFAWADHQTVPLSPDVLATLVNRGWLDEGDAAVQASYSGMNEHRFSNLTKAVGTPLSPGELGSALRRGIIDQDRFDQGVRESNLRREWLDVATALIYSPPSAGEVMAAYTANQLTEDQARELWRQNGMRPEDFGWVAQTTGPPPPTQEMITLWRRGDVTEAEVREAILEGPTKNKWVDTVMKFKRREPPMEQVLALTRRGVFTAAEATTHLANLGFDADVVSKLVTWATTARTETGHQLSVSAYLTAYKDGLTGEAETTAALTGLGYSAADAAFLVRTATFQRDHAEAGAIVTNVRSRYVGHHIDRADASADLDALGVDPAQRDRLLRLWDVARGNQVADLTVAQLTAMVKKGLMDVDTYAARLTRHGYAPGDVDLLVQLNTAAVAVV